MTAVVIELIFLFFLVGFFLFGSGRARLRGLGAFFQVLHRAILFPVEHDDQLGKLSFYIILPHLIQTSTPPAEKEKNSTSITAVSPTLDDDFAIVEAPSVLTYVVVSDEEEDGTLS